MRKLDFYFDFISPFSYIAYARLNRLPADVQVRLRPVLFAGLLAHWGHTGPAELAPKRKWTYRWCHWWANSLGLPFRFPAKHPFNPLRFLRLSIACGNRPDAVGKIFSHIWTTGGDAEDEAGFRGLADSLGLADADASLNAAAVKEELRRNTSEAVEAGLFGVPGYVVDGEVFWGADALDFVGAFLRDPAILRDVETARLDALPVGVARAR